MNPTNKSGSDRKVLSIEKHLKKKKVREALGRTRAHLEEIADLGGKLVRAVGKHVEAELEKREREIDSEDE